MALVGVELETLVFEPDALTTRPLTHIKKDRQNGEHTKSRVSIEGAELWLADNQWAWQRSCSQLVICQSQLGCHAHWLSANHSSAPSINTRLFLCFPGRVVSASGSETSVSSSMPTSAIIYDAYTNTKNKKSFEGNEHSTQKKRFFKQKINF